MTLRRRRREPCWFLNYASSSGLVETKSSTASLTVNWARPNSYPEVLWSKKKCNRACSMWGRLTLLWDHREQGYTFEQCGDSTYWRLSSFMVHELGQEPSLLWAREARWDVVCDIGPHKYTWHEDGMISRSDVLHETRTHKYVSCQKLSRVLPFPHDNDNLIE